jgi:type 1 glutamine amidotransferase
VAPVPVFWTHEPAGGGRAFVCVFGHYMWTFDDPLFRLLLLRGMAWAAGEPASRFDPLALDGVTMSEP